MQERQWHLLISEKTPRLGLCSIAGQTPEYIDNLVSNLDEVHDPSVFVDTALSLIKKVCLARAGILLDDELVDSLERSVRRIVIKRITQIEETG